VPAKDLEVSNPSRKPAKNELDMAGKLVESLQAKFDPERYEDTYRERLLEYIEAKSKGKVESLPKRTEAPEPDSLMAALEASVSGKG
jgi:DNA end-binding protein Ku